jgi:hypothetical protein
MTPFAVKLETVAFSRQMLDAGFSILDTQECAMDEILKHRVSRIGQDQQLVSSQHLGNCKISCVNKRRSG